VQDCKQKENSNVNNLKQVEAFSMEQRNFQDWKMAAHNSTCTTDMSTAPLLKVLDTNRHLSMYVWIHRDQDPHCDSKQACGFRNTP
jgi:hypothetical protein